MKCNFDNATTNTTNNRYTKHSHNSYKNHSNKTVQQVSIRGGKQEVASDDFITFNWCSHGYYKAEFTEANFNKQTQTEIFKHLFNIENSSNETQTNITQMKFKLIGHVMEAFWSSGVM